MVSTLHYQLMAQWPALAWVAVCEPGSDRVFVLHGPQVETHLDWFCEAVWDGTFAEADFDRTDLIYGSGGRRRFGQVSFVSPGTTTDRLQYLEGHDSIWISNSLACLLAISGTEPDPQFRGYIDLFSSIKDGIERCAHTVPMTAGVAQLVYYHNLQWDGRTLRVVPKRVAKRDFSSYELYLGFLQSSLRRLAENLSCPERAFPYTWQGSLSRGYDSPTAVALASEVGLQSALSFRESRPGVRDDGHRIANALGVEIKLLDRLDCHRHGVREPLFLSADGQGKEMMLSAAADLLQRRVFVTGFGGDYVWSQYPKSLGPDLARGGYAGLSLTEYRLHSGFINCPVPFMGMTQVEDICRISQAPGMRRWDIGNDYSRPICRRVLEERGVARDWFGTNKTGASIRYVIGQDPWSAAGHKAFQAWILRSPALAMDRWPKRVYLAVLLSVLRLNLKLRESAPHAMGLIIWKVCRRIIRHLRNFGVEDYAFIWGMDHARKSYSGRAALQQETIVTGPHARADPP